MGNNFWSLQLAWGTEYIMYAPSFKTLLSECLELNQQYRCLHAQEEEEEEEEED